MNYVCFLECYSMHLSTYFLFIVHFYLKNTFAMCLKNIDVKDGNKYDKLVMQQT